MSRREGEMQQHGVQREMLAQEGQEDLFMTVTRHRYVTLRCGTYEETRVCRGVRPTITTGCPYASAVPSSSAFPVLASAATISSVIASTLAKHSAW